ncbi:putative ankyrin repeat- containing protein [Acanthamoeba polyphaga mimivirus]|nr:ankyrin repeat-containing protein [Acanthamoeba castellanii mamavirus]EJN41087.1 ankyrin containing protein [Acanthamoeba polyphaga lentillevirus]QTF49610.1 ankyrin repeat-containing protein [Mimivirus reunion]UMZ07778.1 putative ankyrin repeat- containing protein [Acanthamoeba polyphaga mimivirus]WMV62053.1 ankyrin repeat-containing protein [Mimivirus sp.]
MELKTMYFDTNNTMYLKVVSKKFVDKLNEGYNYLDDEYKIATLDITDDLFYKCSDDCVRECFNNDSSAHLRMRKTANELVSFTDYKNIFGQLRKDSVFVLQVFPKFDDPEFQMQEITDGNHGTIYKANRFYLGEKFDLGDVEVVKFFIKKGTDIHLHYDSIQRWAFDNRKTEVSMYLFGFSFVRGLDNFKVLAKICRDGNLELLRLLELNGFNETIKLYAIILSYISFQPLLTNYLLTKSYNFQKSNITVSNWKATMPYGTIDQYKTKVLLMAIANNHAELVQYLLTQNPSDKDINHAMLYAVTTANASLLDYTLKNGGNIHYKNDQALILAVRFNHISMVRKLICLGMDSNNVFALTMAAENNHQDIVQHLINRGADVNANNRSALIAAVKNGHLKIVQMFVNNGADIKIDDTVIKTACKNGHNNIVKYLLGKGVSCDDIVLPSNSSFFSIVKLAVKRSIIVNNDKSNKIK